MAATYPNNPYDQGYAAGTAERHGNNLNAYSSGYQPGNAAQGKAEN